MATTTAHTAVMQFRPQMFGVLHPELTREVSSIVELKGKIQATSAAVEIAGYVALNAVRSEVAERTGVSSPDTFNTGDLQRLAYAAGQWTVDLTRNLALPGDAWRENSLQPNVVAFALDDIMAGGGVDGEERA